ncbi:MULTISPECIES: SIS domain-containing protein [unclassified Streptomyces]|uniref:MurR/RpiR family transcriptional regulator n=1 Tax=unclassified Streptomyces TaxID=2593676 RepID=UPI002E80D4BE|nr:SIS domain-containing protein [Streptomyces sp. NBC_00569]WSE13503.1 SIS domain-containing protein [Streptomyces sp. NBC_01397]WUB97579.1 SIS domain-containing protein [Streptomyces sp. NBC_00569]
MRAASPPSGQGSYASVGVALAHNAALCGDDVVHICDPANLVNTLGRLQEDDLLIAINCWQIYTSTVEALNAAAEKGVGAVLITDSGAPLLGTKATLQIAVPSEGVGFFPSLIAALAVVQSVVVELSAMDPNQTRRALASAEHEWQRFKLLSYHRSVSGGCLGRSLVTRAGSSARLGASSEAVRSWRTRRGRRRRFPGGPARPSAGASGMSPGACAARAFPHVWESWVLATVFDLSP